MRRASFHRGVCRPLRHRLRALAAGLAGALAVLAAAPVSGDRHDLAALSLEELMDLEVTLAGRKVAPLYEAAAALAVLTRDDIRRAGVNSIPEALRLVPGMVVARVDANKWAISARGFNGRFANKLLVLVDGRSVYSPTFSGVYWELQDVVLEDVERIEVIRGPGATLWGANAVNGIVNVVTRAAGDTRGALLQAGRGRQERGTGTVRYGGGAWRVWAKAFDHDGFVDAEGAPTADDWRMARVGFRLDRGAGPDTLCLQADAYGGRAGQTFNFVDLQPPYARPVDDDTALRGADLLGRWRRRLTGESDLALQLYYDRTDRADALVDEVRDTWDADFQHRTRWRRRHDLVWGLGYRYTRNDTEGSFAASLTPPGRGEDLVSAFVQDEVRLARGRVQVTAGAKFEHNDHTGFEHQPSARLWWEFASRQALWASAARALRTPSQADDDVRLNLQVIPPGQIVPGSPLGVAAAFGRRDVEAEKLYAFELGYRAVPADALLLDAAGYYNVYRDLRTGTADPFFVEHDPPPTHLVFPYYSTNALESQTWGVEVAADGRVLAERTRLRLAYTYLDQSLRAVRGSDPRGEDSAGENPRHQLSLWSSVDVRPSVHLDAILRGVGRLPSQRNDAYLVADLRLAWQLAAGVEAEVVARNLLDRHHPEFRAFLVDTRPTETETEVRAAVRWRVGGSGSW